MEKNSQFSMEALARLLATPAGQQMLRRVRATDPNLLTRAVTQASRGDYDAARQTLAPLLDTPEAQALLGAREE